MKRYISFLLVMIPGLALSACGSSLIVSTPTSIRTSIPASTPTLAPTSTPASTPTSTLTLFEEDFEDDKAQGFKFQEGNWRIVVDSEGNRVLDLDNTSSCCLSEASFGSTTWADYAVEYRVKFLKVRQDDGTIIDLFFRKSEGSFGGAYYIQSITGNWVVVFYVPSGGQDWNVLGSERVLSFSTDIWYFVRVEVQGENIRVFLDDYPLIELQEPSIISGSVGLAIERSIHAQFDDIKVIPLGNQR
jgi:hypothetical protein